MDILEQHWDPCLPSPRDGAVPAENVHTFSDTMRRLALTNGGDGDEE